MQVRSLTHVQHSSYDKLPFQYLHSLWDTESCISRIAILYLHLVFGAFQACTSRVAILTSAVSLAGVLAPALRAEHKLGDVLLHLIWFKQQPKINYLCVPLQIQSGNLLSLWGAAASNLPLTAYLRCLPGMSPCSSSPRRTWTRRCSAPPNLIQATAKNKQLMCPSQNSIRPLY